MKQLLIFAVLTAAVSSLSAGEIRTVSVSNAIEMALVNNTQIKQMEQDVAIAQAQYNQSFADLVMPKVGISSSLTILDPDTVSNGNQSLITPNGYQTIPGAGPSYKVVPSGVNYYTNYYPDNYSASLNLNYPVFTGFKRWNSLQLRQMNLNLAQQKYEDKKREITYNTISSFYNLFLLKENIALSEHQTESLSNQAKNMEVNYDNGSASEYDKIRVNVLYKNNLPRLLSVKNAYKISRMSFCDSIGIKNYDQVELSGSLMDYTNLTVTNLDESNMIELALSNDINLKTLDNSIVMQKLTRDINDGSKYPTLSTFANFKEDYKKSIITNVDRSWVSSWNFGLQLSIPVDDWFSMSKTANLVAESDANMKKSLEMRRQLSDNLTLQVRSLILQIEVSKENIDSQQENVNQAAMGLNVANARIDAGTGMASEMIDSEFSLTQAQTAYLQAIYDYYSNVLKLKRMIG